jgi:RimJ/RimL family protein N-acetyltransferase
MDTAGQISIREGALEDLDRVTAKIHEFAPRMLRSVGANEEQVDEWLMIYASRNRWRRRLTSDTAAVMIAERDDLIVGIGYLEAFEDIDDVLAVRLGGLYVRYGGQGIGTAIMKDRLRRARKLGADYVQLETAEVNTVMRNLAERYKFQINGRYKHQILGKPFLEYRRALTDAGEDYLLDIGESDHTTTEEVTA